MRVSEIMFRADPDADKWRLGFKGVGAEFPWPSAVVLFGPNDVGKSNILEAVRTLCNSNEVPAAVRKSLRVADDDQELIPRGMLLVELDATSDDASIDSRALAQLIQLTPPQISMGGSSPGRPKSQVVGLAEDLQLTFGSRPLRLSTLRRKLRDAIIGYAESSCAEWEATSASYIAILDACLASRRLLADYGVDWIDTPMMFLLSPPSQSLTRGAREALETLAVHRTSWPDGVIPVLDQVVAALMTNRVVPFLLLGGFPTFRPFDIVEFAEELGRGDVVEDFVRDELEKIAATVLDTVVVHCARVHARPMYLLPRSEESTIHSLERLWLEEDAEGKVRVHPIIDNLCARVSQAATALAPEFIRRRYRIVIEAVPVSAWDRHGRVRVRVCDDTRERTFDLDVVGSGTTVWVGYSIAETARMLASSARELLALVGSDDFSERLDDLLAGPGGQSTRLYVPGQGHDGLALEDPQVQQHLHDAYFRLVMVATPPIVSIGEPSKRRRQLKHVVAVPETLFLFDEPERHLHPAAQEQAAAWVASLVARGARVLLATHSPPFLNLRTATGAGVPSATSEQLEDVEYLRVFRNSDGLTLVEPLSAVMTQHVDTQADALGLSRAQLIQVLRAVLVVEGAHDERVILHCYSKDLARDRILVLPLRGVAKAKFLAEAEVLRAMHIPMILLFDNTADPASSENKEVQRLYERWPKDAPRPQVVPFSPRDIIDALPDEYVERAIQTLGGRPFPGWRTMRQRFDASNETNFKHYVLHSLRLSVNFDEFVDEVLRATPAEPLVGSPLHPAIESVRALSRTVDSWFGVGRANGAAA